MAHTIVLCNNRTELEACQSGMALSASMHDVETSFCQGQSDNGEYWLHIENDCDEDNATFRLVDGVIKFEYSGVEL